MRTRTILTLVLAAGLLASQATLADAARPGRAASVQPAVAAAPTTTTATVTPVDPIGNEPVRVSITVTPWGGVGEVSVWVDDAQVATVTMASNGTGNHSVHLTPGRHTIVVRFSGYLDWLPSESAPIQITQVAYGASRVTAYAPEGPLRALRIVDLRATTPLALDDINGSVGVIGREGPQLAGATVGTLVQNDHTLYPGDWQVIAFVRDRLERYLTMASCPVDFSVTKHVVSPRLTSPDLTIDWSKPMVLDYVAGAAGVIPAEADVEVRVDDGRAARTVALLNGKRRVTLDPSALGSVTVTARIGPDEFLEGPVRQLRFSVVRGVPPRNPPAKPRAKPTQIRLDVVPTGGEPGSGGTVSVDVDPATAGRVILYSGARPVGEATIDRAGKAVIRHSAMPPGSHPLIAIYQGTQRFAPSRSVKRTLTIPTPTATTLTLEVEDTALQHGASTTATATVTPNPGGGTVTIHGSRVGLDPATGSASVIVDGLRPGVHRIDAEFPGSPLFARSRASTKVTVASVASSIDQSVDVGVVPDGRFARGRVAIHLQVEPERLAEERDGRYDLFIDGRRIQSRDDGGSTSLGVLLDPGTYDIQVKYRGNGILDPSETAVRSIQVGTRSSPPKELRGTATLVGPQQTATTVVKLKLAVDETGGDVRGFQISNDGDHWATWWLDTDRYSPEVTVPWSLVGCGAGTGDGPRTVRVRFLDDVAEELETRVPVPAGGVLRSDVVTIPVVLSR
jgi:hypothetical protein